MTARFFLDQSCFSADEVVIFDKSRIFQIQQVLRLRRGEEILFLDNSGKEYWTVIEVSGPKVIKARIINVAFNQSERVEEIYLYQALPKQLSRFEWVLQKGTELGVKGFIPMLTKRTERKELKNRERMLAIIREAAEQSGRGILPVLEETQELSSLRLSPTLGFNLVPYELERGKNLTELISDWDRKTRLNILIGPEGGFDENEVEALKGVGWHVCSLGSLILRTETAGIAVVSRVLL